MLFGVYVGTIRAYSFGHLESWKSSDKWQNLKRKFLVPKEFAHSEAEEIRDIERKSQTNTPSETVELADLQ